MTISFSQCTVDQCSLSDANERGHYGSVQHTLSLHSVTVILVFIPRLLYNLGMNTIQMTTDLSCAPGKKV